VLPYRPQSMFSNTEPRGLSRVVVLVEDPGAVNFLGPLVDRLVGGGISTVVLGLGVGAQMVRERGHAVIAPPDPLQTVEFIRLRRPSVVVVGTSENPDTPAFTLMDAARAAGVPTVGVVDARVNAAFRFRGYSQNPLAHAPDWLVVPDESTAVAFRSLGFARHRIFVVENPARDLARRRGRAMRDRVPTAHEAPRSGAGQVRVIFVAEVSDGLDAGQYQRSGDYTLHGRGGSSARTAVVIEELLDACVELRRHERLQMLLILRLHPKQRMDDLGPLCEEFDEVSAGGDPLELVATADLVVGMTSMLLVQAHDIGVPCLSVLPRDCEKAWLPEVESGSIPSVTTRAAIISEIRRLLTGSRQEQTPRGTAASDVDPVEEMFECLVGVAKGCPQ